MASTSVDGPNPKTTPLAASGTSQGGRNRQLAVHHATLLQQRKDTEATILDALEELIEFPTSPTSTAKTPKTTDLKRFQILVAPFQLSDYDSLIEERNCANSCGYVFCPNDLKRKEPSGNYSRILRGNHKWGSGKDQDIQIVPSAKFDMWCDPFCAKAALYVKLQLSEVPAWERAVGTHLNISLLSDVSYGELASEMRRIGSERRQSGEVRQMMEDLALERGERSDLLRKPLDIPLRERFINPSHEPVEPQRIRNGDDIEGYRPREVWPELRGAELLEDENEDVDQDWDLT